MASVLTAEPWLNLVHELGQESQQFFEALMIFCVCFFSWSLQMSVFEEHMYLKCMVFRNLFHSVW